MILMKRALIKKDLMKKILCKSENYENREEKANLSFDVFSLGVTYIANFWISIHAFSEWVICMGNSSISIHVFFKGLTCVIGWLLLPLLINYLTHKNNIVKGYRTDLFTKKFLLMHFLTLFARTFLLKYKTIVF